MKYDEIAETDFILELHDGMKIHGIQRGVLNKEIPLVVIMHGLPGSPKKLLPYLGSRYLHERGFTTLSLYMYDTPEDYRDAFDCLIETHVSDYEEVISFLRKQGIKKIFAIGHSFGGLTILKSKVKIEAAVLWDPSHGLAWENGDVKRNWNVEAGGFVISTSGGGSMRPEMLQKSLESFGDTSKDAANVRCPVKIITGDKSPIFSFVPRYMDYISAEKQLVVIEGAGHGFDEQDIVTHQLFRETSEWLQMIESK